MTNRIFALAVASLISVGTTARALELEDGFAAMQDAATTFSEQSQKKAAAAAAAEEKQEPEDQACDICWNSRFKPLTEKAKFVKAWEEKRAGIGAAGAVTGFAVLGALIARAPHGADGSLQEYQRLKGEADAARAKAIAAGGMELTKEGVTRLKLVKGVDYKLED
jgi:hypothetical protein